MTTRGPYAILDDTRDLAGPDVPGLLISWMGPLAHGSRKEYQRALGYFTAFWQPESVPAVTVARLLAGGCAMATAVLESWRLSMEEAGLSGATMRCRLSALLSLLRKARRVGLISWAVDVPMPQVAHRPNLNGPTIGELQRVMRAACAERTWRGVRDYAILRLMYDLGLRRGELLGIRTEDLDDERHRILIRGKGSRGKGTWIALPTKTRIALEAWLAIRRDKAGTIWFSAHGPVSSRNSGSFRPWHPLTADGLRDMIERRCKQAGVKRFRPHAVRHSAITRALDLTSGDIAAVAAFARHKDPRMTLYYDDARQDRSAAVSSLLSDDGTLVRVQTAYEAKLGSAWAVRRIERGPGRRWAAGSERFDRAAGGIPLAPVIPDDDRESAGADRDGQHQDEAQEHAKDEAAREEGQGLEEDAAQGQPPPVTGREPPREG